MTDKLELKSCHEVIAYYTDSSCDIFISSIHELQHALRLCGIPKEIEL